MPGKPFISMDVGRIKADIDAINTTLDKVGELAIQAAKRAMVNFAEDVVAEAQANIRNQSGGLSESATVEDPVVDGGEIIVRFGFNKEYARQRDQGGTIEPVNARMLAIPLPPIIGASGPKFASPREEGDNLTLVELNGRLFLVEKRKRGGKFKGADLDRFHWMLVPRVEQEGSRFFSEVVEARMADAARQIAEGIQDGLGGGAWW
jgi:hypothetical protein